MVRKKNAKITNFEESSRPEPPMSEEEPIPLQSINPLAIEIYNTENDQPIESMISTEFDTSDENQHVEENPKDGKVRNDEENLNNEEIPNVEENPLAVEAEFEEINVDTFVAK